jgi:hypothetical protein
VCLDDVVAERENLGLERTADVADHADRDIAHLSVITQWPHGGVNRKSSHAQNGTWPAMREETRLRQPEQADGAGRRGPLVRECDRHTYLVGLRGAQSGKEKRVEVRHVPAHPYVVCTVHRCCPAIL